MRSSIYPVGNSLAQDASVRQLKELIAMRIDRRKNNTRIHFDPAINVKLMAIDGTWCRECLLVDVSDTGAQLLIAGFGTLIEEFFLVLSSVGTPAFRRCKRAWVKDDRLGVWFEKQSAPSKILERSRRNWASTPN
jgi:hypothetical protein